MTMNKGWRSHSSLPVIISAAQFTERVDSPSFEALSPADITAKAACAAIDNAVPGGFRDELVTAIDTLMAVRTFEDSAPVFASPFGRSNNMPASIAKRLGLSAGHLIWGTSGGDTPQQLVAEACQRIELGQSQAVLVCGGEAIATARYLAKQGKPADWSETLDAPVDDRGADFSMLSQQELAHGLTTPALFHGLIENARRAAQGWSMNDWQREMGELMASLCRVASRNPYSAAEQLVWSADDIVTPSSSNRMIAHPFTQRLMAKDRVNQSAAVVVVSEALANKLEVPAEQRIYLLGHGAAGEPPVTERADMGSAPSAGYALKAALSSANVDLADIDLFDFYSCFPVAVFNAISGIGMAATDLRGLTLTGGLPYFGGPGNNYSLHAIAEAVTRLQGRGGHALVAANGGFLSKYAVGVYSTEPPLSAQQRFENVTSDSSYTPDRIKLAEAPKGAGRIETYTVDYHKDGSAKKAIIVGVSEETGERFIACTGRGDTDTVQTMAMTDAIGMRVYVTSDEQQSLFTIGSE